MKILIISGFLGAGKTTFIRELVRRTGREMAILENEYAAAGVDGRLLENSLPPDKSINIWELTEGCICCSTKGDFAASVLTIANTVNPEFLIVEPTGVGKLSNVIANLRQIEYERISLLAPVTIIDGKSFWHYQSEYPDIFKDQITASQTLVLSKMEHADGMEIRAVETALLRLNPEARILTSHYSQAEDSWWTSLLEKGCRGEFLPSRQKVAEKLPTSCTLETVSMGSPEELLIFLEELIRGRFGNIIRAKGVLYAGAQSFRFDVADGQYILTSAGIMAKTDGKAVFIGENIARRQIMRRFKKDPDGESAQKRISYRSIQRKSQQL
ncbi:MAG: GTP-binding protein [Lachnospiraceae bacterium]|nr:GTP-binding protein [Lachnospiraceae bacterium]